MKKLNVRMAVPVFEAGAHLSHRQAWCLCPLMNHPTLKTLTSLTNGRWSVI
jgi:hypothetical protein